MESQLIDFSKIDIEKLPPDKRRRLLQLLREKKTRQLDALRKYKILPAPAQFHKTEKPYAILLGGNRSGKTEALCADVAMTARDMHPHFDTKHIKNLWVGSTTWQSVGEVLWKEKLKHYIPASLIKNIIWHNKQRGIPLYLELHNEKVIEFKSYEQGREAFQARSIPYIALDEQASEGIWQECQMRVLDCDGVIRQALTPIIYQEYLKKIVDAPPPEYWIGYANLNDNRRSRGGFVPDHGIDSLIQSWPESVRKTRIEGRFAAFAGVVFQEWNPEEHLVLPRDLPKSWEWYISIDFGYNNPFCALLVAKDPDGCYWFVDEHFQSHTLMQDHAKVLQKWKDKYPIKDIFADHAAQDRAELDALGIHTKAQKKNVVRSIEAMSGALRIMGNNKSRVKIFRDMANDPRGCPNLIREIPAYRWAEKKEEFNAKEEVIKLDDHAVDAAKALIFSLEYKFIRQSGSMVVNA